MSKTKKIIITVAIILGVIILGVLGVGAYYLSRISYVSQDEQQQKAEMITDLPESILPEETTPEPTLVPDEIVIEDEIEQTKLSEEQLALLETRKNEEDVVNILLMGVDRRGDTGNSRSDSMLIATLDKPNKRLKLTSLMRDMYLPIYGRGSNRLNSASNNGGPKLVIDTINENFSLNIQNYVMVDFDMFEQIVDMVGGVTIDMSKGEVAEANDCIAGLNKQRKVSLRDGFITQRGGDVTLTGKQALGYCRIRHFGNGDYARTSRQYKVLQAIFDKYRTLPVTDQLSILSDVLPFVQTDLSPTQIISLMTQALGMDTSEILYYRLPVDGYFTQRTIRGMWVVVPDIPANAQKLHEFIYDATSQEENVIEDTKAGSYHTNKSSSKSSTKTAQPAITQDVSDATQSTNDATQNQVETDTIETTPETDIPMTDEPTAESETTEAPAPTENVVAEEATATQEQQ